MYREDDDESEEEEDISQLSHAQKQELAEKIGQTDGETLSKVISIIQQSTNIGGVSFFHREPFIGVLTSPPFRATKRLSWILILFHRPPLSGCTTWFVGEVEDQAASVDVVVVVSRRRRVALAERPWVVCLDAV